MFDKYNDVFRFVPLNGDILVFGAFTDSARDAWFSPIGFNRGRVRNIYQTFIKPNSNRKRYSLSCTSKSSC